MRSRFVRAAILAAAAFCGLVGAHVLDYVILFRDPARRLGLLHQSGHAYFGRAIEFAIASAILAAVGSLAFGYACAHGRPGRRAPVRRQILVLVLIQSGGFVALEAAERALTQAAATHFLKVTLLGVFLQAIFAAVSVVIFTVLERAGELIARALASRSLARSRVLTIAGPHEVAPKAAAGLSRASPRAPPLALAS